eukprot:gnl/MRDRNA2_/MRDRNA2_62631_c0_seq1.p1 gnl/MRDRNA2_/MRDRNA2_62631_c0~~gnl/MRDRNA2_/MRDRNA2_62631_c0_seq1.p1  ORF type:complete len:915 (-),score=165.97 gnl/MRDRNA2_/MRDRNA2_62631_c0_seq1:94-2778(-)
MDGDCRWCPSTIKFPKFVEIHNRRLAKLHWVLFAFMVIFPIADFALRKGYLLQTTPTHGVVHYWANNWNPSDEHRGDLNNADAQKEYCTSPSKYEYCDTEDCSWSAKDMACIDLCTVHSFQNCMESSERWFKDAEGGIFFPTFFTDYTTTYVPGSGADADRIVDRRVEVQSRIMKGVEDMGIGFDHGYVHENPEERSTNKIADERYDQGLLTIVRKSNMEEIMRFQPGQSVDLSVKMLLDHAGVMLDNVVAEYGANKLADAVIREGILTRLAGAEIDIEISYENPWKHGMNWQGPVAYLTIRGSMAWKSRPLLQVLDFAGSQRMRYYQGVQIRFRQKGTFGWFDLNGIIQCLTSLIVLASTANTITAQFAYRCLGGLSTVYRGFCHQKAQIGAECHSMAARLASYTSTFLELEDVEDPVPGISRERLLHRFTRVFGKASGLTDLQIKRFVHFVFDGMNKSKSGDENDSLDVEEWLKACAFAEPLGYDSLVQMFDADRKKGFLERFFAPDTLQAILKTDMLVQSDERTQTSVKGLKGLATATLNKIDDLQTLDPEVAVLAAEINADKRQIGHLDSEVNFYARMRKMEKQVKEAQQEALVVSSRIDKLQNACDKLMLDEKVPGLRLPSCASNVVGSELAPALSARDITVSTSVAGTSRNDGVDRQVEQNTMETLQRMISETGKIDGELSALSTSLKAQRSEIDFQRSTIDQLHASMTTKQDDIAELQVSMRQVQNEMMDVKREIEPISFRRAQQQVREKHGTSYASQEVTIRRTEFKSCELERSELDLPKGTQGTRPSRRMNSRTASDSHEAPTELSLSETTNGHFAVKSLPEDVDRHQKEMASRGDQHCGVRVSAVWDLCTDKNPDKEKEIYIYNDGTNNLAKTASPPEQHLKYV